MLFILGSETEIFFDINCCEFVRKFISRIGIPSFTGASFTGVTLHLLRFSRRVILQGVELKDSECV